MSLVSILIALIVFGLIYWLITAVIPLPPPIRTAAIVVLVVIAIIWLLQGVGMISGTPLRIN